jgi:hypothetical protein
LTHSHDQRKDQLISERDVQRGVTGGAAPVREGASPVNKMVMPGDNKGATGATSTPEPTSAPQSVSGVTPESGDGG